MFTAFWPHEGSKIMYVPGPLHIFKKKLMLVLICFPYNTRASNKISAKIGPRNLFPIFWQYCEKLKIFHFFNILKINDFLKSVRFCKYLRK